MRIQSPVFDNDNAELQSTHEDGAKNTADDQVPSSNDAHTPVDVRCSPLVGDLPTPPCTQQATRSATSAGVNLPSGSHAQPAPPADNTTPSLPPLPLPSNTPKALESSYNMLAKTVDAGWGPSWTSCVRLFLAGEEVAGFPDPTGNQLYPKGHLEAFAQWFKEGRQPRGVTIKNIGAFADTFYSWYHSLQPPKRGSEGRERVNIPSASWLSIRRPGKNGTYLILVGLAWIARHIHSDGDGDGNESLRGGWAQVVEDVAWVLEASSGAATSSLSSAAYKYKQAVPPEHPRKRARR